MRVIITYASAGAGHFKAAQAMHDYLKECCPGIELKLVDILDKTNPLFKFYYSFGYSLLVKRAPFLWRIAFWFTELKAPRSFTKFVAHIIDRLNAGDFINFLIKENPDFIISTHFLPSQISAFIKKDNKISSKLITVITDFSVHPFWVSPATDMYIVATAITKEQLVRQGVDAGLIKDSGIPVHPKFLKQFEKLSLCKKFRLEANKFTVLVATGSFGIGPIEEIIKLLHKDVQLLIVCANNKELYKKLKQKAYPGVSVFGFVDNMQELMAVSDLIITKPGGLTISEILKMELIPIFISAIPGQEAGNVEVLKQYGIGLIPDNTNDIKNIILDFKEHPDKIKSIKDNIKKIKNPDCLTEICNVVCKGSPGHTC